MRLPSTITLQACLLCCTTEVGMQKKQGSRARQPLTYTRTDYSSSQTHQTPTCRLNLKRQQLLCAPCSIAQPQAGIGGCPVQLSCQVQHARCIVKAWLSLAKLHMCIHLRMPTRKITAGSKACKLLSLPSC
jgi:hypothetical protein